MLLGLRKAWSFLKNYWYIPVVIAAIVVLAIMTAGKGVPKSLLEAFRKARETHAKEVDVINEAHREEIEKREAALAAYHKHMEAIEKQYAEANEELDAKKRKEIEKLVKANADDPTELTKRVADVTGFDIVLPGE